jgi:hypothetical protein
LTDDPGGAVADVVVGSVGRVESAVALPGDDPVTGREVSAFGGLDLVGPELSCGLEKTVRQVVEGAANGVAAVDHGMVAAGDPGGPPAFQRIEVGVAGSAGNVEVPGGLK